MIIKCINCNKKFNVNDVLIPVNGRQIACGSCNHSWYFQVDKNTEKTSLTQSESVARKKAQRKQDRKHGRKQERKRETKQTRKKESK